jgi:FkbM family methyltransferase
VSSALTSMDDSPGSLRQQLLFGEFVRWYVTKAKHPYHDKLIGHYWRVFTKNTFWVKYDSDLVINVSLKDYIQSSIFFNGYYERTIVEWLCSELSPTDVFWDVGANIGAITLVAARRCARVVAFEPEPTTMAKLRNNVHVNGLNNVRLEPIALSDQDGDVMLTLGPECNSGMNSIALRRTDRPSISVKTTTADAFLSAIASDAPTVMKIDVEGAEARVLRGAPKLLTCPRLRAIMFESKAGAEGRPEDRALLSSLEGAGFRVREFGPSDGSAKDTVTNYLACR